MGAVLQAYDWLINQWLKHPGRTLAPAAGKFGYRSSLLLLLFLKTARIA
jgi:hypothetical protein